VRTGSRFLHGMWVPLSTAHSYLKDHLLTENCSQAIAGLDVFLSPNLVDRFAPSLATVLKQYRDPMILGQFGREFGSMLQARKMLPSPADQTHSSLNVFRPLLRTMTKVESIADQPLSPAEKEVVRALCVDVHEWDLPEPIPRPTEPITTSESFDMDLDFDGPLTPLEPSSPVSERALSPVPLPMKVPEPEAPSEATKPLRRSRRVADAAAATATKAPTTTSKSKSKSRKK
jgi:hypothetical protein